MLRSSGSPVSAPTVTTTRTRHDQPARPPLLRKSRLGSRRRREDALAWRRATGPDPSSDLTESLGTDTLRACRPNRNRPTTSCPHTRIGPVRAALSLLSVAFGRTLSAVHRPDGGSVTGHRSPIAEERRRQAPWRPGGRLGFQAGSRTSSSRSVAREPGRREIQVHRPSDFHWRITRYPSASSENRLISEAGPTKSAVAHMSAHIRLGPTTVIDPERSTKVSVAGL
jgi:hypothetical protein